MAKVSIALKILHFSTFDAAFEFVLNFFLLTNLSFPIKGDVFSNQNVTRSIMLSGFGRHQTVIAYILLRYVDRMSSCSRFPVFQ